MKTLMKTLVVLVAVVFVTSSCDQSAMEDINPRNKTENPGNPGGGNSGDDNSNNGGDNNGSNGGDNNGINGGNNGNSNDLHAGVPVISGLTLMNSTNCNGGIKKAYRNSSNDYNQTIEKYLDAMSNAGFTSIGYTQGGGWGSYGGRQAWGYLGKRYVKINAQVQQDLGSVVYVCAWSSKPQDDDCDDD